MTESVGLQTEMALWISGIVLAITVGGACASEPLARPERATLLLVRGAAGTEEFGRMFDEWESRWREAAARGDVAVRTVGIRADARPLDEFRQAIADESGEIERPLWIVLIGHGTFDGRDAKFNLTGPDVSAEKLAAWLQPVERPLAVIHCGAASAPFLDRLSRPGRVVITATKTGNEVNFARFGEHLSHAIGDLAADLDKDGQVSLLEAFLTASRQTQNWYDGQQQLRTEHALLDDTGDGHGVRDDFFEGLLPVKAAEGGLELDGHRAHQWHFVPSEEERRFPDELRPRRDELELEIARL
ncbi:MAG: hypothetical protein AB7U20_05395, partial [Planctomycetaceae bacterium]